MTEREARSVDAKQRIDKWLFFARITKSRSIAQALIQSDCVSVNSILVSKANAMVGPGDRLELVLERRDLALLVKAIGARRGPSEEARLLYEDVTPVDPAARRLTPFERAQRSSRFNHNQ